MAKPTVKTFIEILQRSKLVEEGLLKQKLLECKEQFGERFRNDIDGVVNFLVASGVISQWHCEKLLNGKYKGFQLGKYKLLDLLGTGGMSSVYLAEHTVMRRKVAIKVLPKRRVSHSSYLERFHLEAQATARLDHPNIVRAYDIDNEGNNHFIVMEYVRGRDLQAMVKDDGPLEYDRAAHYIAQSARGLQHAHESGLVHRDVKPGNLLIDDQGVVKILDLGLALFADEERASLTLQHNENVLGTADFLAPEQAVNSHDVDARADIYGLGCTLYFALTAHAPFPEGSLPQRIAMHQSQMPVDIRLDRPDCPQQLVDICVKMIQKRKEDRFQNCREVAEALENCIQEILAASRTVKVAASEASIRVTVPANNARSSLGSASDGGIELTTPEQLPATKLDIRVGSTTLLKKKGDAPTHIHLNAMDDTVPELKILTLNPVAQKADSVAVPIPPPPLPPPVLPVMQSLETVEMQIPSISKEESISVDGRGVVIGSKNVNLQIRPVPNPDSVPNSDVGIMRLSQGGPTTPVAPTTDFGAIGRGMPDSGSLELRIETSANSNVRQGSAPKQTKSERGSSRLGKGATKKWWLPNFPLWAWVMVGVFGILVAVWTITTLVNDDRAPNPNDSRPTPKGYRRSTALVDQYLGSNPRIKWVL